MQTICKQPDFILMIVMDIIIESQSQNCTQDGSDLIALSLRIEYLMWSLGWISHVFLTSQALGV